MISIVVHVEEIQEVEDRALNDAPKEESDPPNNSYRKPHETSRTNAGMYLHMANCDGV